MASCLELYVKAVVMDKQQNPSQENLRYESDTARLVRRHLSDPNHVFTEEELASIRVGSTPMPDVPSRISEDGDDIISENRADHGNKVIPGAQTTTPWDAIE